MSHRPRRTCCSDPDRRSPRTSLWSSGLPLIICAPPSFRNPAPHSSSCCRYVMGGSKRNSGSSTRRRRRRSCRLLKSSRRLRTDRTRARRLSGERAAGATGALQCPVCASCKPAWCAASPAARRRHLSTDQPIGLLQYLQNVLALGVGKRAGGRRRRLFRHLLQSVSGRRNTDSGENTTARSMKFCSSRILPGQSCALSTSITSSGITSMGLLKRADSF